MKKITELKIEAKVLTGVYKKVFDKSMEEILKEISEKLIKIAESKRLQKNTYAIKSYILIKKNNNDIIFFIQLFNKIRLMNSKILCKNTETDQISSFSQRYRERVCSTSSSAFFSKNAEPGDQFKISLDLRPKFIELIRKYEKSDIKEKENPIESQMSINFKEGKIYSLKEHLSNKVEIFLIEEFFHNKIYIREKKKVYLNFFDSENPENILFDFINFLKGINLYLEGDLEFARLLYMVLRIKLNEKNYKIYPMYPFEDEE
jgi:hypothetical protein